MVDRDLVLAKLASIERCLGRIAVETGGDPATLDDQDVEESFMLLERGAALDPSLSARMQAMVGFRNIAVHEYQAMDRAILKAILTQRLEDLRAFVRYGLGRSRA